MSAPTALPSKDRWAVLVVAIFARTAGAVQFQSVGATGSSMLADASLGIGYGGLGLLIGAYMLPGILLALPAGWLAARHGERRIALVGLLLMSAGGLLIGVSGGMATALIGRAVSGAGSALLTVVLSTMVIGRFAGDRALVPALGGMLAAWPLGVGLALVLLPPLAEATSWRVATLAVAGACGMTLLGATLALRQSSPALKADDAPQAAGDGLLGLHRGEFAPVAAAGTAWVGQNVAFAALLGFAPVVLAERGMSVAVAGVVASLAGWVRIPLLPFGGALADRTGRPVLAASLLHGAAAIAVLVLAFGAELPVALAAAALLAAGLLSTPPGPVIMSLPARVLSAETRSVGMGVFYTFFYLGMAVLPPMAGWAGDIAGTGAASLTVVAGFHLVAIGGLATFAHIAARRRRLVVLPPAPRILSER
ncbi:MFS transporter [Falsiroseomonas sp. E2-1-a20]|uniref:MFS transporter n=1 Tax=Falsiroseomonas sp. E2-1-a20 TaxID=3239300 RepID=UPI003F3F3B1F